MSDTDLTACLTEPPVPVPVNDISKDKDAAPVQPRLKTFPKTQIGGQKRSFNSSWYEKYNMLEYSVVKDRVYCFCCRHFPTAGQNWFITGFSDWKNMPKQFENHFLSSKSSHQFSLEKYAAYTQSKASGSVATQISSQYKNDVIRNREVLATHVQVILLCAQQDIALRGHRENDESMNKGNFLEILQLLKQKCPDYKVKSENLPNNAKYISHEIQNEILNVSGCLVRNVIANEICNPIEAFAIIADESKDKGGIEQLSICLRYIHDEEVKERFVAFMDLHKFDAESITSSIIKVVNETGLNIKKCVAQAYDGSSTMSGDISGVKTRISDLVDGFCPYVHCYAHRLNLVLVDCCSNIPELKDLFGLLQAIYNFQCNSVLRSEYFQQSQKECKLEVLKMPQSCQTRWSSKKVGLFYFRNRIEAVIMALEEIVDKGKPSEAAECKGYINQLQSFTILLLLVAMDEILGTTNTLSEYLQNPNLIYTQASSLCQATIITLKDMRSEDKFDEIWKAATFIAEKIFVQVPHPDSPLESTKRRKIASKLLQDSVLLSTTGSSSTDIPTISVSLRSIYFEIIDRFVAEMSKRLIDNNALFTGLLAAEPRNNLFMKSEEILKFSQEFSRFGFNIDSLKNQIPVAKNLFIAEKADSVMACYKILLPMRKNFSELFLYYKLVLTIPVSSATSERSFSSLNRIKSLLRTTMVEYRSSNLTLLSINRDLSNRLKEDPFVVVDEFGKLASRRLSFAL